MTQILAVAAGGAVGSVLRYLISRISHYPAFPEHVTGEYGWQLHSRLVLGSGRNSCDDIAGIPRLRVDRAAGWIHHLLHIQSADAFAMASRTVRFGRLEYRAQCDIGAVCCLARLATGSRDLACSSSLIKRINHEGHEGA